MRIKILVTVIFLLAAFLRFYKLGIVPPSLNADEVSMGYNAYSILKTGSDEYGNHLPLLFRSYDTYNPALSVYTLVPTIAAFGLNSVGVRLPSAIVGTLTVLLTYFLALKLTSDKKVAILASLLLAISPWHLQFSRYHHEANLMLFLSILAIILFLYSQRSFKLLVASAITFGLAVNTWHGAKFWVAIFIASIAFWYHKEILIFGKKLFFIAAIIAVFYLPVAFNLEKAFKRPLSVSIFAEEDQNHLEELQTNYLSHFSFNFLFNQGDLTPRHSVQTMGEMYYFELPFLILGIFSLLKNNSRSAKFMLTWLLLAPLPAAFAHPAPHAARAIAFLPLNSIIVAIGMAAYLNQRFKFKLALTLFLALLAFYNLLIYFHLYYKHYSKIRSLDWQDGYKQMVEYVNHIKENYDVVAIRDNYLTNYIFVLFYSEYDPAIYQKTGTPKSFDKFIFFSSLADERIKGKALIVTDPSNGPATYLEMIKSFDEPVFKIYELE